MLRPNPQSAFSETKCFKDLYFQAGALVATYTAESSENAVIERRPFRSLSGDRCDWFQAKHHFSPADANSGWGPLRFWNDDEIAPNSGGRRFRQATNLTGRSGPILVVAFYGWRALFSEEGRK